MARHRYICENGCGRRTEMTEGEYARRSALGRLVFCELCRNTVAPKRLVRGTIQSVPMRLR